MPPVVQPVPMPVVLRLFVIHVLLGNTTTKPVKRLNLLLVKVVVQGNTKMKLEKQRATTRISRLCTRNGRVASVATVVVVGVKLLRKPRVERGRMRWVGVIRRRVPSHGLGLLPGVLIMGTCTSTLKTQTSTAAATKNVSAPLFAHPGPTKIKPVSPRANHAPVAPTKTNPGSPRANHVVLGNPTTS